MFIVCNNTLRPFVTSRQSVRKTSNFVKLDDSGGYYNETLQRFGLQTSDSFVLKIQ